MPKLAAVGLTVNYGGQPALRDIHFSVPAGTCLALVGPSGCGKSTLLRCLNRMHDLDPSTTVRGQVLLDGQDIYAPGADPVLLRRRVGMVFQRPWVFPMSIYDNVAFGPRLHGLENIEERVRRALEQAGLWHEVRHRLRAPAATLSGGQQQRLCLARALAVDPEVLLLDEPTSALDPAGAARFEALVQELKGRLTLVLVTHDLGQAVRVAGALAVLVGGELVAWGPTDQVLRQPPDPRAAAFLAPVRPPGRFCQFF